MPSPEAAARNRSTRRHANWFVKSTCTGSRQSQCRTASATGPQLFTSKLEIRSSTCSSSGPRRVTGLHSTTFRGVPRHSMSPVQTEAQASPSFSLLLFTPCPSHLIPSPPRARDIRSGRRGSSATNAGSRNGCRMQHSYEFETTKQRFPSNVLFESQPSSCFFTVSCGRIDFVRLKIRRVIGTLNNTGSSKGRITQKKTGSVNCGSPFVADPQRLRLLEKSEAMPSRYSTARFGGVTVVLAGDPKQCLPVTLNGSVRWSDRCVGRKSEAMPSRYSTAQFGGVTIALAEDPKQCLPVILKSLPTQIVDACCNTPSPSRLGYMVQKTDDFNRCILKSEGASADKHASSGRCKPHGRNGTGKGTGLCRLALRSSELETARQTKQKTIALPREEVEYFRERAKLGVDRINDMVLDLLLHCYRWTTARILIVARRLGGLKISNDIVNGKGCSLSSPAFAKSRQFSPPPGDQGKMIALDNRLHPSQRPMSSAVQLVTVRRVGFDIGRWLGWR
ncbi:BQ5605_C006g04269 [Microbotryum silenes-dioicae]|uniref:BQ5605_C006g04269 protein n=1 Tax=Microbotryum silenes-dioicae TaxID=796604 RepID=A0A2X0M6H5_9BASI|nr:BQ5605_C006g04269 [Microbotryum silenes-dioicae]